MRLFFFLLVLVNLVFFAWAQGYFGQSDEGHEPERLNQQLHADKLRIARLDSQPAKAEEQACRLVSGLKPADAESLKTAAEAGLGGQGKITPQKPPALYLVLIGDLPNKALADKKIAELTRFGVDASGAVALEGGRHEIILGSFPGEAGAGEFLQVLAKKGVKSARLEAREQAAAKAAVEIRGAAALLPRLLPQLIAPYADATVGECAN